MPKEKDEYQGTLIKKDESIQSLEDDIFCSFGTNQTRRPNFIDNAIIPLFSLFRKGLSEKSDTKQDE
jgi:hypothetical protein